MVEQGYNVLAVLGLPAGSEWVIILILAVLLFGHRLPNVAKSIGKSITEFRKGLREAQNEIEKAGDEDTQPNGKNNSSRQA